MTVAELIETLRRYDPTWSVCLQGRPQDHFYTEVFSVSDDSEWVVLEAESGES